MLLPKLAEKIVQEVRKLIGEDIIVVNTDGSIIASTDKSRVGTFHEGAKIVSKQKRKLIITEREQQSLAGTKAGINFPIFFQNDVIGVIGITGDPQKVTPFGEIIRKMTELIISENYYAEQFDRQARAMETFVMDWIQSEEWNDSLLNRARLLNVDLRIKRRSVIIEFDEQSQMIPRDTWSTILSWFASNKSEPAIRWGNERLVLLMDCSRSTSRESAEKRLRKFIAFLNAKGLIAYAGVGQVVLPSNIRNSFRQAERAVKIAKQKRKIIFDEELTFEMILDELNPKAKMEFIQRTIGPILEEKEWLDTLKELVKQNNSLKNTAKALHIHINTLYYRLKKIEESTQLDPNNFHDLVNLYLAINFLDEYTKNQ